MRKLYLLIRKLALQENDFILNCINDLFAL